jgi:hypothetical protein
MVSKGSYFLLTLESGLEGSSCGSLDSVDCLLLLYVKDG